MAGRDDYAAGRAPLHCLVADHRGRRRFPAQIHGNPIARYDLRYRAGKLPSGESGIVTDDQAISDRAIGPQVVGQALGAAGYIGKGEVVRDDAAPAVGTEFNCIVHSRIIAPAMNGQGLSIL